jgi:hypothetical protein
MRELAEADAADAELAHIAVSAAAKLASVVGAHRKLRLALRFFNQALFSQFESPLDQWAEKIGQ